MDQEKIGKFICERRKKKKMTQSELAEKLGVTDKTISRWENGHYLPDVSLFNELCEILDIEVTELLKGEKMNKVEKKDVEETIDKIVDISKKEIKKNNKKVILISCVVILLVIFISGLLIWFNRDVEEKHKTGETVDWPIWVAYKEKDNGWVCSFQIIQHLYDENEEVEDHYSYWYTCDNYKYQRLSGFTAEGKEIDEEGIFVYEIETNHPMYEYNDEYSKDLNNISDYFKEHQFTKKIEIEDLVELELKYISKEEVLELYNKAISSKKIDKYGKYPNTYLERYLNISSLKKNNYSWYVGIDFTHGHITYVNLELKIGDKYLSDLIKEEDNAEAEYLEIYNNILKIEKYIIEKQKLSLPKEFEVDRPYTFLKDNFQDIERYETEIENE